MKSQKGVTLISLTVYIIAITLVIGVVGVIGNYFYSNVTKLNENVEPLSEYTRFNSFFSEEVNNNNIKILKCESDYIVFNNGVQYKFIAENSGIYRNKVKIAKGVESCTFQRSIENGKERITVSMIIGNKDRQTIYTLR